MTKRTLWLALLLTTALSGCIGPAIVDAAHRWDDYDLLAQRQLDADHFVAIVSVEHNRGEFDVLGSHGSHVVTRSVDVLLLRLAVTPGGLQATRLDARKFESEKELDAWRDDLVVDFDATSQHLQFTGVRDRVDVRRETDLVVDDKTRTLRSRVRGQDCAVPMPPHVGVSRDLPRLHLSEERGHAMVDERVSGERRGVLLDLCDPAAPRHAIAYPDVGMVGITAAADGGPGVLRYTTEAHNASFGQWRYEAQLYPGPEVLAFDATNFGLSKDTWRAPLEFIVDAPARRFHWILLPYEGNKRLLFFTHDFATDVTTRHEAPFPGA